MRRTAYIGIGSNLASHEGGSAATVEAAILRLDRLDGRLGGVLARSSLFETAPVGSVSQPAFVNAVVAIGTVLSPLELLGRLLDVEREFGRDRKATAPKGPRSLDLDILLMDELVIQTPELTVPHPALHERRFVLAPLAEIAPDVVHPVLQKSVLALLAALPDAGQNSASAVRRLGRGVLAGSVTDAGASVLAPEEEA